MSAIGTPAWEQSKENAAPLQRGRNVTAQEQASAISPQETEHKIQQYERLVRPSEPPHVTAMDCDPLSHWLEYIKYYQSAFPTDTREQFLLMERCTRALVKMKQYADDDRFIGVCAKYADKTKDPGQVFKYLHQQKIGTTSALFWVAWAFVAEKDGDFQFAEQIFKKGLSKNAQPLQMLKIRHQQFQRRMSRHWLNASATNDQLEDEGEEEAGTRSRQRALGGISRDRLRRNDRVRSSTRPHERSQFSRSIGQQNTSSQNGQEGCFAIFVEQDGENIENQYNLEHSGVEKNRVLAAEADRRKENSMAAERWNERGGLTNPLTRKQPPTRPKAPPTAFPVFVDEECAARHEQEAQDKQSHAVKHRHVRDERTFRERTDDESAAKLARDPLRYVLNPSQRDKDLAEEAQASSQVDPSSQQGTKRERKCKIGFDKRLLKDRCGEEQSFEEARANAQAYTIFPSSDNFNLLKQIKHDTSSQMDCGDGGSFDSAMTDSENTNGSMTSYGQQQKPPRKEGRVLFRNEASFEGSLNQTAISTASSTIHPTDAVGIPGKRDEETINTKFAMKELSMMFSSPAFGVDEVSKKTTERQAVRLDRSMIGGQQVVDTSFDAIGDMIGNTDLDNSIINAGSANINDENIGGPRNPSARAIGAPDIDQMALQEIDSEEQDAPPLSCGTQSRAASAAVARSSPQDDPFRGKEVPLSGNPGFQIFEDIDDDLATRSKYDMENDSTKEQRSDLSDGSDESQNRDTAMYENDAISAHNEDGTSETGDTVTSTLFNELFAKTEQHEKSQETPSGTLPTVDGNCTDGEDTATSSLFNEVVGGLKPKAKPQKKGGSGFSIFVDGEENLDIQEEEDAPNSRVREKKVFEEEVNEDEHAVDYIIIHERDVRLALQQVHARARVASDSKAPLSSLLSQREGSYHLPHVPIPREFRKKFLKVKTAIRLGKHEGMVMKELGRGAYGVVVLMDGCDDVVNDKIAVKVQSPTDCLAWEQQILLRVEQRVSSKCIGAGAYPFPRALSFVSLADGGMLGMTTGSKSGLNLIDLVNIYASRTNENVPELIALHYTSKMLRLIEILHWHGRILHCDVKPDNFVLSDTSTSGGDDIKFSDLVLVDFGRAIDLEGLSNEYDDVRKARFIGNAAQGDTKCIAMRNGNPWSYDIDTFGILGSAHVLLFGSHMELRNATGKEWKPAKRIKRYWKQELWDELFTKILNHEIGSHVRSLRSIREKIDLHLKEEESTLRAQLVRQEHLIPSSREKIRK